MAGDGAAPRGPAFAPRVFSTASHHDPGYSALLTPGGGRACGSGGLRRLPGVTGCLNHQKPPLFCITLLHLPSMPQLLPQPQLFTLVTPAERPAAYRGTSHSHTHSNTHHGDEVRVLGLIITDNKLSPNQAPARYFVGLQAFRPNI